MTKKTGLEKIIIFLLLATALTPLVITSHTLYPFIFGKIIFFRVLVETAFLLFGAGLLFGAFKINKEKIKEFFKNPLVITLGFFLLSIVISTLLAGNTLRAFWGGMERGGGLFGMLHYFVFLGLALAIFSRKDWIKFFKIFLLVGFVEIFYGFLQFFRVENFPFALETQPRIGSFIENPAFFAAYLFFVIISAVIVWWSITKPDLKSSSRNADKFWKYISVIIAILSIVAIFMTGTRGALVGLGTGILFVFIYLAFSKKENQVKIKNVSVKKISAALLILFIVFGGFFLVTKNTSFWQKVPGLNRLAQTEILSVKDTSTQTRLITWGVSLDAFKENPVFGWGEDNYSLAYNKYYNPKIAKYGETWIDRAHNKLLDILVMRGMVGLLAYLLLFGVLISRFIRKPRSVNFISGILISGLLIGYFTQNLVLFDDITAYIPFFALLGFTVAFRKKAITESNYQEIGVLPKAVGALLILVSLFSLYRYNFIPYNQAKTAPLVELTSVDNKDVLISRLNTSFHPYTYIQPALRGYIVDHFYNNYYFKLWGKIFASAQFEDVSKLLLKEINEVALKTDDPRMYIRETLMYNEMGKRDQKYYKNAEEMIRKAMELVPKRQELYYQLAIALGGQMEFEKGLEVAKQAVELAPGVARAYYHLGLMRAASGHKDEALASLAEARRLAPNFRSFFPADIRGFIVIYAGLKEIDKMSEIVLKISKKELRANIEQDYYNQVIYYYLTQRNKEKLITVIEGLSRAYRQTEENAEILIDLAKNERWEVLDNIIHLR